MFDYYYYNHHRTLYYEHYYIISTFRYICLYTSIIQLGLTYREDYWRDESPNIIQNTRWVETEHFTHTMVDIVGAFY